MQRMSEQGQSAPVSDVWGTEPGLKRLAFTIPVSMTYLILEMVTDVSAMLVDRMIFRHP